MDQMIVSPVLGNIMIVDDTPANLQVLTKILTSQGHTTRPVLNGRLALQAMQAEHPDLVLMDINMPGMNGLEVCQAMQADKGLREIPVIFLSALSGTQDKIQGFKWGGADYITKPFQIDEVIARINTHLKLHKLQIHLEKTIQHLDERIREQVKEISDSQMATIFALAKLSESRDDDTGKHLDRVRTYCRMLSEWLAGHSKYRDLVTPDFIDNIYHASPLHDIGKVGIPDRIVLKPARLTPEEFEVMKQHTQLGAKTLEAVADQYPHNSIILMGIDIARSHHENWNGKGYPDGMKGSSIPLAARITAVADVYDALRSKRIYKPALGQEETHAIILAGKGIRFDPIIVDAYCELRDKFAQAYEEMRDKMEIGILRELAC